MGSVGVAEAVKPALHGLLLLPCLDAGVRVPTQVVGSRRPLFGAQLPVCGPRLVVDADYAARGSLRRHKHSVADRAVDGHLGRGSANPSGRNWLSIDLLLTGHPAIVFKGATAAPKRSNRPP